MSKLLTVFENLNIRMNDEDYKFDPQAYIRIDRSQIQEEIINQQEYYVHWGLVGAIAQSNVEKIELELDLVKDDLDGAIRRASAESVAAKQRPKPVTESEIKSLIGKDAGVVELKKSLIEATRIAAYIKSINVSLFKRFDTLKILAGQERSENFNAGNVNPNYNMYNKENKNE